MLEIFEADVTKPFYIDIASYADHGNQRGEEIFEGRLSTPAELQEWSKTRDGDQWVSRDRPTPLFEEMVESMAIKPQTGNAAKIDHINPTHYKEWVPGMQWFESRQHRSRNFAAECDVQVDKYLSRNGGKDKELQEMLKAKWYLDFWIAWTIAGTPIKVDNVGVIIKDYMEGDYPGE